MSAPFRRSRKPALLRDGLYSGRRRRQITGSARTRRPRSHPFAGAASWPSQRGRRYSAGPPCEDGGAVRRMSSARTSPWRSRAAPCCLRPSMAARATLPCPPSRLSRGRRGRRSWRWRRARYRWPKRGLRLRSEYPQGDSRPGKGGNQSARRWSGRAGPPLPGRGGGGPGLGWSGRPVFEIAGADAGPGRRRYSAGPGGGPACEDGGAVRRMSSVRAAIASSCRRRSASIDSVCRSFSASARRRSAFARRQF